MVVKTIKHSKKELQTLTIEDLVEVAREEHHLLLLLVSFLVFSSTFRLVQILWSDPCKTILWCWKANNQEIPHTLAFVPDRILPSLFFRRRRPRTQGAMKQKHSCELHLRHAIFPLTSEKITWQNCVVRTDASSTLAFNRLRKLIRISC